MFDLEDQLRKAIFLGRNTVWHQLKMAMDIELKTKESGMRRIKQKRRNQGHHKVALVDEAQQKIYWIVKKKLSK